MSIEDFYDFNALFKDGFTMRSVNEAKEKFYWRDVKWIRYTKEQGILLYKTSLLEDAPFSRLNMRKQGKSRFNLESKIQRCNQQPIPISKEKYKDLQDVLHRLRPEVRDFYRQLPNDSSTLTYDPDIEDLEEQSSIQDDEAVVNVALKPVVESTTENASPTHPETDISTRVLRSSKRRRIDGN